MFSKRTAWPRIPTPLATMRAAREAAGQLVVDLTCTNPTRQGFVYAPDQVLNWMSGSVVYEPDSKGLFAAREAVCAYLKAHGGTASPDDVLIGSGTSELYRYLMDILCDPDGVWLVPQPGYPLLDYLADCSGVRLKPYPMAFDGTWRWREADLLAALREEPHARALVVVSPHNPTGHAWSAEEQQTIVRICHKRGLALIVDEVFLDYPLRADPPLATAAGLNDVLTCTLSGLSKVAAFPQGKLAWVHIGGPAQDVAECMARAALVADAFLCASTILQAGTGRILDEAPLMQERIRARCRRNLAALKGVLAETAVTVLEPDAGWSALLRFPNTRSDEAWSELLLSEYGVLVQPGYLFGMEAVSDAPYLAVSLLTKPDELDRGAEALREAVFKAS